MNDHGASFTSHETIVPIFQLPPRPWLDQAACRGLDPALFHPQRGEPTEPAKRVCASCPVRQECLDWALEANEKHGVWGGMSERQRRQLRIAANIASRERPIDHGTYRGYAQHRRRGEQPCEMCREAHRDYHAADQRARREVQRSA